MQKKKKKTVCTLGTSITTALMCLENTLDDDRNVEDTVQDILSTGSVNL